MQQRSALPHGRYGKSGAGHVTTETVFSGSAGPSAIAVIAPVATLLVAFLAGWVTLAVARRQTRVTARETWMREKFRRTPRNPTTRGRVTSILQSGVIAILRLHGEAALRTLW